MIARVLVAVLGAGLFVALAPSLATARPAYPPSHCTVTIKPASGVVKAGGTIQVSGSFVKSTTWTVTFNGKTRHFTGKTFSTTLRAPNTKTDETLTLTVSCGNGNSSAFTIEVLGSGKGGGGHLPNTGGPSVWWLIFAGLAGASGSFLMWRGRRRHGVAPAPVSQGKHALRR
ncbi:MAG: LPXTG cell wall anchor domain-containing protein [Marmoricola sp.]